MRNKVVRVQVKKGYSYRRVELQKVRYSEDVVTDSNGFANFVLPNLRQSSNLKVSAFE